MRTSVPVPIKDIMGFYATRILNLDTVGGEQSVSSSGRFDQEGEEKKKKQHRKGGLQSTSARGDVKTIYELSYITYNLILSII